MQFIPFHFIRVVDRQRKKIDPEGIDELVSSIKAHGLLQPPVVIAMGEEVEGTGHPLYRLVAGGRRLIALGKLIREGIPFTYEGEPVQKGMVPVTVYTSEDEYFITEAELHENIIRQDLTWQERTAAISKLHNLRKCFNPEQTDSDTGRELVRTGQFAHPNAAQRAVAIARVVADHLDDPEVKRAESLSKAYRIVHRKLEAEFAAALPPIASPHTIIEGSLFDQLPLFDPGTFNVILADPPYGIGADEFGTAAAHGHDYSDDAAYALRCAEAIFREGWIATKPEAHLFLFCDIELFGELKLIAKNWGWEPWRTPLIWRKSTTQGHAPRPEHGPRRSYEMILFATKGGATQRELRSDVLDVPPTAITMHAAEKPTALYIDLLSRVCGPSATILDPCCGSGVIFPAAHKIGAVATGIDNNPDAVAFARKRISELGELSHPKPPALIDTLAEI